MVLNFVPESELEDNLIQQLIEGESQWTYRDDLHTEEELWQNLKEKLEKNNKDVLCDVPLTEQEFRQIQEQLQFVNFYEAAKWLAGENGIAKVQVQREDAALGTIRLKVLNRADIAGGMSSYEVINQYQSNRRAKEDQERRFDVTLLINGIPMIHIELKNRKHSYMDGFRQIKKYLKENKFTGIFSAVQMFVMSNGTDTRYIATARDEKLNEQFLSKWVDHENQPINNYLDFAKAVLSIPQAHKMVTQYTVIDSAKRSLILLRPYQIHAIEAVKEASRRQESGYIWHTTGSGKTLTSYKVARNLLQIPSLHKTIFIVDRVDLDQQTTGSFESYAEHDVIEIDETDNVNDLIKKLLSDDRTVVVTTIQKLNHVMKRFEGQEDNKKAMALKQLKIAFVVDECHRAVSPQKQKEIKEFFVHSLWYGFTGTPIFAENAKKVLGDLPRTTEGQYGKRLHEYTVKEAIYDKAVLGFQIEYKSTFSEEELDDALIKYDSEMDISNLTMEEKEARLPKIVYEDERHMLEVIHSIINKSRNKIGFQNGVGNTYNAILTTSSIAQAQRYYDLFKRVKAGETTVQISEKTKRILPDFPKVAMTYSISENEETSIENQEKMKEALLDYNKEFDTSYKIETMRAYNRNVNDRLARKKEQFLPRSEQLDIIIVVDRLLTGFDAPCLSTLFIDRPAMKPQDLIQAFSRTNRLFNKAKKYGQIVTFQTPKIFEEKVKQALVLYSNGGENEVTAPTWEEAHQAFLTAIEELHEVAPVPESIDIEGMEKAQLQKFAKAYQALDRTFANIQVYTKYSDEQLGTTYPIRLDEIEEYHGKYVNALEKLRKEKEDVDDIEINIEYELESVKTDEINYEYILQLIQTFLPKTQEKENGELSSQKMVVEINQYISWLKKSNPNLAEIMGELWTKIQANPENYRDQYVSSLLEEMIQQTIDAFLDTFVQTWCVQKEELEFMVANYNPNHERQNGEAELKRTSDYNAYKEHASDPVTKLKYWKTVKNAFEDMMVQNILPLQQ
ncbi:type I restriction enzyme R subunit [Bacillus sp. LEw-kw-24]|uniref:type I restriction endonuclease subunit R n=1 Tax=unclassified Bacillus (in: firmicutes) TaxID=185979 RepID=UPI002405D000|nr:MULTISPECIES: type I restriction endonuclease subunit R [unclassified Bacillus (in: firmicutes)]MDF9887872.1 type I restriction enzyme R subunit [Bacillus sp. LEw-kw-24]MDH6558371.1 type I restriction enzyme R subunit [Bacillus sp. LEw-kw-2]